MKTTELWKTFRDVMRVKHYAWTTEECYRGWIQRYIEWLEKHGHDFTSSESRMGAFLTKMAHQGCAASTQNQAFNAILFLYREVLKQDLKNVTSLRAKRPAMVRYAPSKHDIIRVLDAIHDVYGYPCQLITKLLYGCGLRVTEPLNLRVKDVDISHSRLMIRGAKGGKDRVVSVPCGLMTEIVAQMKRAKLTWEQDVKAGLPIQLPGEMAKKYKNAPFSYQWSWVFPSKTSCQHPRTGETVRYRMHEANVQKAVKTAATPLGLEGAVTPHCFRHSYCTHVLDAGACVGDVQVAMGHAQLTTTQGYYHAESARVISPLA
jgi:integron integrase